MYGVNFFVCIQRDVRLPGHQGLNKVLSLPATYPAGGQDKRVRAWDLNTGQCIANYTALRENIVPSLAFELEWGQGLPRPAIFAVDGVELTLLQRA